MTAWIVSFRYGRPQSLVLDGQSSTSTAVSSGVLKETVLRTLLFLLFINGLPYVVSSTTQLFADDYLLYRRIRSSEDQMVLQIYLQSLQQCEDD